MADFIPKMPDQAGEVPWFEDANESDGWRGMATSKSVDTLRSELTSEIGRLGGMVVGFQEGTFPGDRPRDGFIIRYVVVAPNGDAVPGEISVAALPVDDDRHRDPKSFHDKALRMALYMMRDAMAGTRFLQALSPGYAALMPWMLEPGTGKTITRLWSDSLFGKLLPSPSDGFESDDWDDAVEGEFEDV